MTMDFMSIKVTRPPRLAELSPAVQLRVRAILSAELAAYERACHDAMTAGDLAVTTYRRRTHFAERFVHFIRNDELAHGRPTSQLRHE
jgi:hypothetical protein